MDNLELFFSSKSPQIHEKNLSTDDILTLQIKMYSLLERRIKLYNLGDSASIRKEEAEELMSSIIFTLEKYLSYKKLPKSFLLQADLNDVLNEGIKITERERSLGKALYEKACLTAPLINNIAFKDTLKSIKGFFKKYDYHFLAHEIPGCSIDYPLARPIEDNALGIDFINRYLSEIIIENEFLSHFKNNDIISLLKSYCPDYQGLIINLYEPVLTNSLGLSLASRPLDHLSISDRERQAIYSIFKGESISSIESILKKEAAALCQKLNISYEPSLQYASQYALTLSPRIAECIKHDSLKGLFLP